MTAPAFELHQLVEIKDRVGFYWITRLPTNGDDAYTLFGGRVQRRGGAWGGTVTVRESRLVPITNKYTMKRAEAARRVITEAMAEAPKAHHRKAGKK